MNRTDTATGTRRRVVSLLVDLVIILVVITSGSLRRNLALVG